MIAIGIDPGKSGGLVIIDSFEKTCSMHKCPQTTGEMASILRMAQVDAWMGNVKILAAIEKVHAFPTDARNSAFKFGMNYGMWLGSVGSLGIPLVDVTPQKWMKDYAPLPKEKQERKKKIKQIAIKIFSAVYETEDKKITYAVSDAALIALWCKNRGDNEQI